MRLPQRARGTMPAMIKSLIILVLTLALAAGAFLSRPSPSDFKPFIKQKFEQSTSNPVEKFVADMKAESFVKDCTIKDRLLWVSVQKDGKSVYTGAFNQWWGSDQAA